MELKLHLLDSFNVTGADGQTYKVLGYERLVRDTALADGHEHWEPTGQAEYRLADGARVDVAPDGSLVLAHSGLKLMRGQTESSRQEARDV